MNPDSLAASLAMRSLPISDGADFDESLRAIKRGPRKASVADGVVSELRAEVFRHHVAQSRSADGTLSGAPKAIADVLGTT